MDHITMSRQHFQFIADVIASQRDNDPDTKIMLDEMSRQFADALARTNANFDHERFLRACGV